jgi:hypothetical protein
VVQYVDDLLVNPVHDPEIQELLKELRNEHEDVTAKSGPITEYTGQSIDDCDAGCAWSDQIDSRTSNSGATQSHAAMNAPSITAHMPTINHREIIHSDYTAWPLFPAERIQSYRSLHGVQADGESRDIGDAGPLCRDYSTWATLTQASAEAEIIGRCVSTNQLTHPRNLISQQGPGSIRP